jgi:hypothetical protein
MENSQLTTIARLILRAVLGLIALIAVFILVNKTTPDSVVLLQILTTVIVFLTFLATRQDKPPGA